MNEILYIVDLKSLNQLNSFMLFRADKNKFNTINHIIYMNIIVYFRILKIT